MSWSAKRFEEENVGKFLNEHFVSIKVDREERPDVDKIYMTFVQSTTGGGGWPLNVFLTPDLKPFFGGTYFPPDARHGRPSFLQLLEQIAGSGANGKWKSLPSADELHARLELLTARDAKENSPLTPPTLQRAAQTFKEAYDPVNGGFGDAPKFPQPSHSVAGFARGEKVWRCEAVKMVLHTCDKMAAGGIHDQLGGGFARYAVDAEWLVPHFEKMLYDNAQLAQLYLDAHLIADQRSESRIAVRGRRARHPGLCFARHDPSRRRLFFRRGCRQRRPRRQILLLDARRTFQAAHVEEFNVAAKYFGVTAEGNFVDHSHPSRWPGQNVLSVVES